MNSPDVVNEYLELRREKQILDQIDAIQRANGVKFYVPHQKPGARATQDAFHRAQVTHPGVKHRFTRAGNRWGKSDMCAAEIVSWMLGYRAFYHILDPARFAGIPQRPVKILLIVQDWEKSTEIFTEESVMQPGKFWKMLPKDEFSCKSRNHSGAINMIETKNGSRLHIDTIKSFMQNPMGMESSDWDLIWVDEPCPHDMFNAAARGLVDRGGQTVFALTPLREPWINDMFVPNKQAENALNSGVSISHERRWMQAGEMHDNPYLSAENIKDFLDTLSPEERSCRERGLPLDRAGLIYKDFNFTTHVRHDPPHGWKTWDTPPANYCVYYALDWHPQTPHAVLFCAVAPTGEKIFYAEYFEHSVHEVLASRIQSILGGSFCAGALCDPLAWVEAPSTGTTNADDLMSYGLFLEKAVKDPRRGIVRVEQELRRERNVIVNATLNRFLWEIDRFVWGDDGLPAKKGNFHMMENLYRLCIHDMLYVEPPTESSPSFVPETSFASADFTL